MLFGEALQPPFGHAKRFRSARGSCQVRNRKFQGEVVWHAFDPHVQGVSASPFDISGFGETLLPIYGPNPDPGRLSPGGIPQGPVTTPRKVEKLPPITPLIGALSSRDPAPSPRRSNRSLTKPRSTHGRRRLPLPTARIARILRCSAHGAAPKMWPRCRLVPKRSPPSSQQKPTAASKHRRLGGAWRRSAMLTSWPGMSHQPIRK